MDLPFALPTSVAGLTLATVYSDEGVIGAFLTKLGIDVVFTRLGVAVAMVFVSFPFVVRTMQPVLQVGGEQKRGEGGRKGDKRGWGEGRGRENNRGRGGWGREEEVEAQGERKVERGKGG